MRHGLELVPLVIMLLRINFLEAQKRLDLMEGGKLARVHLFADRLPRMHREGWTGNRTSSSTAFAWFVWDRGHAGPIALDRIWAQPEKARQGAAVRRSKRNPRTAMTNLGELLPWKETT